jgi:hypothetical protein
LIVGHDAGRKPVGKISTLSNLFTQIECRRAIFPRVAGHVMSPYGRKRKALAAINVLLRDLRNFVVEVGFFRLFRGEMGFLCGPELSRMGLW